LSASGPNVLVIVLDAMREDHVTPTLEEPGRSLKAETCVAAAPWTLPSCTSLLTGADASRHRHFWHSGDLATKGLVGALPSAFKKVGLVNNKVMQRSSQLDTGFDKWTYFVDHATPFDRAAALVSGVRRRRPLFLFLHSNISHDYFRPEAEAYYDEAFPQEAGGAYLLGDRVIRWNDTTSADRAAVAKTYQASAIKVASRTRELLDIVRERDDFVTAVVSDHGEGLDYDLGRVHHGGRLHDDLLRVPLLFDLPSSIAERQRNDLTAALGSTPVAVTDVLPTLFALAGTGAVPAVDGRPIDTASRERIVVSEDRRYLYLKGRFRLNNRGRNKHMTPQERMRNQQVQDQLASPPVLRSYRLRRTKLILTCLHLRADAAKPAAARRALVDLGSHLLGAPVLALRGDRLVALEEYDLGDDPAERRNRLPVDPVGLRHHLAREWAGSVSLPVGGASGDVEVDLLAILEGAELVTQP
jgi:sulfatase-like protein